MNRLVPLLLLASALTLFAQIPAAPMSRPPVAAPRSQPAAAVAPGAEDVQALANDLARMRTLVQQMQMNLAFVQNTQTPLKHQFELEIDMWQTVIGQMERHLQSLRARQAPAAPK